MSWKKAFLWEWKSFLNDLDAGDFLRGDRDPVAFAGSMARMLFVVTIYMISFIPCTVRNCVQG